MKFNYEKLGSLIEISEKKNSDLAVDNLVGMNINKEFIPSVANTIGTNLARYKIIHKDQFACNLMHVGRDKSVVVSKYSLENPSIISPAYKIFQVKDTSIILPDFLMLYFLRSEFDRLGWFYTDSSIRGSLDWSKFCSIEIPVLDIDIQKKIVDIYQFFNDRIELKERINNNLFNIVSSIQTDWMVNFTPFKSNQFKSSSFGLIPENWNVGELGDVIELLDSKRIPLSGQERENMEKIYPYYGAASLMDYVDDYIFDGIYLLIGEDGTVIDDKGFPILQYVWGKFWVNNHAHIVKGKNGFNVDSLYLLLSQTNIQSIVTGAVQAKVNQSNLKSIEIIIPPVEVMKKFNDLIKPFFDTIRSNHDEIKKIQKLRDILLPKLMSGEIDVSEVKCDL